MCRNARLILLLVATSGTLLSLGTIGEAAVQICSHLQGPECQLVWNNDRGLSSSLLKIVVRDIAPNNPGGQNVQVKMCDFGLGDLDDRFQITLIRTGVPKEIVSCLNDLGSPSPCALTPTPKVGTATGDTLFLIIQEVSGGNDGALIQITAPGWEDFQVFAEDHQNAFVSGYPHTQKCP